MKFSHRTGDHSQQACNGSMDWWWLMADPADNKPPTGVFLALPNPGSRRITCPGKGPFRWGNSISLIHNHVGICCQWQAYGNHQHHRRVYFVASWFLSPQWTSEWCPTVHHPQRNQLVMLLNTSQYWQNNPQQRSPTTISRSIGGTSHVTLGYTCVIDAVGPWCRPPTALPLLNAITHHWSTGCRGTTSHEPCHPRGWIHHGCWPLVNHRSTTIIH